MMAGRALVAIAESVSHYWKIPKRNKRDSAVLRTGVASYVEHIWSLESVDYQVGLMWSVSTCMGSLGRGTITYF